jgi:hypothetical protein
MDTALRPRWRKCAIATDAEIVAIDGLEDELRVLCRFPGPDWIHAPDTGTEPRPDER